MNLNLDDEGYLRKAFIATNFEVLRKHLLNFQIPTA